MLYRKPADMKFTDMCIWIDENAPLLKEAGAYPEIEDKIYNYLWLLVKALAIKKRMFKNFEDYDGYAFHSAQRLFFALRKSYQNEGKLIKGKIIKPIKSCLNYTKALLYPMKVEYQQKTFAKDMYLETLSGKFDQFVFKERIKEALQSSSGADYEFKKSVYDLFNDIDFLVNKTLEECPFHNGTLDYKYLKISLLLNCLNNLKHGKAIDFEQQTTFVWKLPKSTAAYIKVMIKQFAATVKQELMASYDRSRIDDDILEYMLTNPNGEFIDHDETEY